MRYPCAEHIKQYREQRDMTWEALAERLSVTRRAVSNWECGKTQPDIETLHKGTSKKPPAQRIGGIFAVIRCAGSF